MFDFEAAPEFCLDKRFLIYFSGAMTTFVLLIFARKSSPAPVCSLTKVDAGRVPIVVESHNCFVSAIYFDRGIQRARCRRPCVSCI